MEIRETLQQLDSLLRSSQLKEAESFLKTQTEQAKFSKWRLAFDRTKPEALSEPAGFFTGTAGIAVALLRLYENETQGREALRLIDDPY